MTAKKKENRSTRLTLANLKASRYSWDGLEIPVGWRWSAGRNHLSKPSGDPGKFQLSAKRVCNSQGVQIPVQYLVTFDDGDMPEAWKDLLFTPLGTDPPPVKAQSVPLWDNKPSTEKKYTKALKKLYKEMGNAKTKVKRLEAYYPVVSGNTVAMDVVRLVYLEGALTNGNDVVAIYFNYYANGIVTAQNGGGSGPPD